MTVVDMHAEIDQLTEFWSPHNIGQVGATALKVVQIQGEFPRHMHEHEDECFVVLSGTLHIDYDDATHTVEAGQLIVVPAGVYHKPHCEGVVRLLLIEPADTVQWGDAGQEAVGVARASR